MNKLEKYIFFIVSFFCIGMTGVASTYLYFQTRGMIGVVNLPEQVGVGQYAELNRKR